MKNLFFINFSFKKAFSLIELVVVIAIIAFIFTVTARHVVNPDKKIRHSFDKLIRLNGQLVRHSKIYNREYRLVFQLNEKGPEQYWVEKKKTENLDSNKNKKPNGDSSSLFVLDESFYSEPERLPYPLQIVKAESSSWEKEKTKDMIYIYYYPKGFAQETKIYFLRSDSNSEWILYLDPVEKSLQIIK